MFLFLVLSSSFLCLLFFFSVIRGRHVWVSVSIMWPAETEGMVSTLSLCQYVATHTNCQIPGLRISCRIPKLLTVALTTHISFIPVPSSEWTVKLKERNKDKITNTVEPVVGVYSTLTDVTRLLFSPKTISIEKRLLKTYMRPRW